MKKITILTLSVLCSFALFAQSTINITTSGGNYPTEKWVSVTTEPDGAGTQIWGQGDGTYGNGQGLINQDISIDPGTYYVNCYDRYADSWDGTLISVTAYGAIIGDNGGVSPDDGTNSDSDSTWEDPALELEASFEIIVPDPPACLPPGSLSATLISADTVELNWIAGDSETLWNLELVDVTGGGSATGSATEIDVTSPYTIPGLMPDNSYEFYVQANCGGSLSTWAGPIEFFTGYCIPASTATTTFTDSFALTGGLSDTTTSSTGYTGTGYADYYDTNAIESFDGGSFDFLATIVGGTAGYAIWVDWNNDLVFDATTETVYNTTSYGSGPFTGTITVPNGTALGDYRLRTMVDWSDNNPSDDACAFGGSRGEVEDYKITIVDAPVDAMDFNNVQWVTDGTNGSNTSVTVDVNSPVTVYAQGYEPGVTEAVGQGSGVECWIAINNENTDPATWPNSLWQVASYGSDQGNNDEYFYETSSTPAGTNYVAARWRLNGAAFTYGGYNGTWDGTNNINIELVVNPLANDDCAGAIPLEVNPDENCVATTPGTIAGATASGNDETACTGTENDDVWFSFIAANDTHIISLINVANGTTDLYHSVYSGSCGTLTNIECSDPNSSTVSGLTIGETYLLRVNSWTANAGQTTTFDVCVATPPLPPANDECANAETIVCGGQYIGDTTFANPIDPDPGFCGTSSGTAGAVWYKFTGTNSNDAGAAIGSEGDEVTLDLSLSTFDTKIRVFEGSCGALTCVAGNDDGGTGTTSLVSIPTTVGTEYYVLVHGYSSNVGEYTLDVSCVAPCFADAGTLTADATPVNLSGGIATISATPNGDSVVPTNYDVTYVLTSGPTLVIEDAGATPSFDVTTAGDYTIHTLVAETTDNTDPNFLDLGAIVFGTTTGGDVLDIVTGAGLCAALDVTGAPITVDEELGIANNAFDSVSIYPNPIKNEVIIRNSRTIFIETVDLYDLSGRAIKHFSVKNNTSQLNFNLSELTSGMYIMILNSEFGQFERQIIKE